MICRVINAIGIIIFLAFVCIASVVYTSDFADEVSVMADEIYRTGKKSDIEELEEKWDEYSRYASLYVDHDDLEEISRLISGLKETAGDSDYIFGINCREIILSIDHIKENQQPKLNNIF